SYNNFLYFPAQARLWRTDGTVSGTAQFSPVIDPGGFTIYKGRLYFEAISGSNGRELFSTDGTTEGTAMLKEIAPGRLSIERAGYSIPSWIYNDRLWFRADDYVHGSELWSTDGTSEGT